MSVVPTFDLFSKRRKRIAGDVADIYIYTIPESLRVQIIHIWDDAFGNPSRDYDPQHSINSAYHEIVEILRREYSVFILRDDTPDRNDKRYAYNELCKFFLDTKIFRGVDPTDKALDVIELTFRGIDIVTRRFSYIHRPNADVIADAAIQELNERFREHGVGYSYSDGQIIRVDSEFAHVEIVKPALVVLRQKGFSSAQSEFLKAHEHYRQGKYPEALVECYKSFESTMKIICTRRNWTFDKSKGAADLVRVCLDKGLIPAYWQGHFSGLRSVLESAIPTPRNKQAGHGAGAQPAQPIPSELVSYVLHMTAATVLFLTEAESKLP